MAARAGIEPTTKRFKVILKGTEATWVKALPEPILQPLGESFRQRVRNLCTSA